MSASPSPPAAEHLRPSTLRLPPGSWTTVLDCLSAHFPGIPRVQWLDRFERARILDANDKPLDSGHAYVNGMTIRYFREVADEPRIPFAAQIIYADDDLVVADKPHFLAVMPAGRFVRETLLHRLIETLGKPDLVPLHRIDRGTAGLVMFSANRATRSAFQSLFPKRSIDKRYEALASPLPGVDFPLVRRSRIVRAEPFFRMREVEGPVNSESRIDVMERGISQWRYALKPVTGRKHQLRVHMAALGAGIANDAFYPDVEDESHDDFDRPLKLLARSLRFADPRDGRERHFESLRTL